MSNPASPPLLAEPPTKRPFVSNNDEAAAGEPSGLQGRPPTASNSSPPSPKRPRFDELEPAEGRRESSSSRPEGAEECHSACCSGGIDGAADKGKGREVDTAPSAEPVSLAVKDQPMVEQADDEVDVRLGSLVDTLEDELACPICSAVLYKPVTIQPGCGHAFCGACLHGYLKASTPSPHICPSCRTAATSASHSRIVSTMVDVLVAHAPDRARPQSEKEQADDIWDIDMPLNFGKPPPPPERMRLSECYRPCRYCSPSNLYGWTCPVPVPSLDSEGPHYPLDGPTPPGHFQCASCSRLAASEAPSTTACSICSAHYCGAGSGPGNYPGDIICSPTALEEAKPGADLWGKTALDFADCIMEGEKDEMMNAFRDNMEELSIFASYIGAHPEHTPNAVWAEILEWLQSDEGLAKGGVKGMFRRTDEGIHYGLRADVAIVRTCRSCTDDIFACGLYEWWERQRPAVLSQLDKEVQQRPDCKNGHMCFRQQTHEHARAFNHVCRPAPAEAVDVSSQDDGALALAASGSGSIAVPAPLASDGPSSSLHSSVSSSQAASTLLTADASLAVYSPTSPAPEFANDDAALVIPSSQPEENLPQLALPPMSVGVSEIIISPANNEEDPDATLVVDEPPLKLDEAPASDNPASSSLAVESLPRETVDVL